MQEATSTLKQPVQRWEMKQRGPPPPGSLLSSQHTTRPSPAEQPGVTFSQEEVQGNLKRLTPPPFSCSKRPSVGESKTWPLPWCSSKWDTPLVGVTLTFPAPTLAASHIHHPDCQRIPGQGQNNAKSEERAPSEATQGGRTLPSPPWLQEFSVEGFSLRPGGDRAASGRPAVGQLGTLSS